MRVGDPVRLKTDSPLRERLAPFADEVGCVVDTFQDDDDERAAHRRGLLGSALRLADAAVGRGVRRRPEPARRAVLTPWPGRSPSSTATNFVRREAARLTVLTISTGQDPAVPSAVP